MSYHVWAWYGMAWYGMVWHGMAWHGMAWIIMAWHGMAWIIMSHGTGWETGGESGYGSAMACGDPLWLASRYEPVSTMKCNTLRQRGAFTVRCYSSWVKRGEGTVDWDAVSPNRSTGKCLSNLNKRISSKNSNLQIWARWGFPTVSSPLPNYKHPWEMGGEGVWLRAV